MNILHFGVGKVICIKYIKAVTLDNKVIQINMGCVNYHQLYDSAEEAEEEYSEIINRLHMCIE